MRIRRTYFTTAAIAAGLLLLATACGSSAGSGTSSAAQPSKTPLTLMFGSSGPAETAAVQAAATAWPRPAASRSR
ncbi:MAG TPA: hypothetical protein VK599_20690 [Streptosporangiaceae bacterium]|nr:hypothetical protein [Streptosporangiaceae bacterium]